MQIGSGAPVGLWKCKVVTSPKNSFGAKHTYICPTPIYILFNPYSKGDYCHFGILGK